MGVPRKRTAPTDRALQYRDLPMSGRKDLQAHVREKGENLTANVAAETTRLESSSARKAGARINALNNVAPALKDKPITLGSAANRRAGLYEDAVAKAPTGQPQGAGWYFDHHADIMNRAQMSGGHFTPEQAITASAVMSPQNAPDSERAAVGALMRAHAGGETITIPHDVAARLSTGVKDPKTGNITKHDVSPEHVGRPVPVHELPAETLAALSSNKIRDGVQHSPGVDLAGIAKGGVKDNVVKAIGVLRGDIHPDDAIDPLSSPKVHSYRGNALRAVPNTPEHVEYMSRTLHHADVERGQQSEHQPMLDLYGLRHSDSGLLNHKGATTEDTWQSAFTSGQPLPAIDRASPAKTVVPQVSVTSTAGASGERMHPDINVGPSSLTHAYNNEATIRAATRLSGKHDLGFHLPAVAVQEVAWTEGRQQAGKDPEYAKSQREAAKAAEESSRPVPRSLQPTLFNDRRMG